MKTELLQEYKTRVERYQSISLSKSKKLKFLSFFRLAAFVGILPAIYYFYPLNAQLVGASVLSLVAVFLFLVKKYTQTEKELQFYQNLVKINQDEVSALNRDFSGFDPGNEFIDLHHDYSFDLDLYGNGSLFQFLNRTVTPNGKKHLAELLNCTKRSAEEIRQRQSAIQELAEKMDWRQKFLAYGKHQIDNKIQDQLHQIISDYSPPKYINALNYLSIVLPPITLLLIGLKVAGIDPYSVYRIAILIQWILLGLYFKTILKFHRQLESQGKLLNQYSEMLSLIENLSVKTEFLTKLKSNLYYNGKSAGLITRILSKRLNQFDYSKNFPVGLVLNSIFLWDIKCICKLNDWQLTYAKELPQWLNLIAEIDALISLGNLNYNHPNWATPIVNKEKFSLNAIATGHPLIDENRCVTNTFRMNNEEQIVIVTGANMAGKSTFLRTIGINLILASNGCKVFAESFDFIPIRVFTNMRTTDNLMSDESYFYAELLRLQTILSHLKKGELLFVIIDEMLKGTNSIDKLNGSKELLKQLILLNAYGIVATHDLGLTSLSETYHSIKNKCFDVELKENELNFDYKLADGVTRTMNASFLMKKMGIIPTE
jgi:DNA mismatch repair ATPase MutS